MARTFLVPDAAKERASGLVADAQAIQRAQSRSTTGAALDLALEAARRLALAAVIQLDSLHQQREVATLAARNDAS